MKKKRILALLAVGALSVGMLAGCGGGSDSGGGEESGGSKDVTIWY